MQQATFDDKSKWPRGPWDQEPDRVYWRDDATGLPCLVRRGPRGVWCGYVAVSPGHRYHGKSYGDCTLPEPCGESYCEHGVDVDVHGGLTYAADCDGDKERGICHVPEPGEPDDVWWLGFDCGHCWDLAPAYVDLMPPLGDEVYRTLDYVQAEVRRLAEQLGDEKGTPAVHAEVPVMSPRTGSEAR